MEVNVHLSRKQKNSHFSFSPPSLFTTSINKHRYLQSGNIWILHRFILFRFYRNEMWNLIDKKPKILLLLPCNFLSWISCIEGSVMAGWALAKHTENQIIKHKNPFFFFWWDILKRCFLTSFISSDWFLGHFFRKQ